MLSANYDLDGAELQNAIMETFTHRGTGFGDIVAFQKMMYSRCNGIRIKKNGFKYLRKLAKDKA